MIPKRRKPKRMQEPKEGSPIKCPGHLKWVRGHTCVCVGQSIQMDKIAQELWGRIPHGVKYRLQQKRETE